MLDKQGQNAYTLNVKIIRKGGKLCSNSLKKNIINYKRRNKHVRENERNHCGTVKLRGGFH